MNYEESDYWEYEDAEDPYDEEYLEEDSGFLGSMLEAQLIRDGKKICEKCGKKVSSVLGNPPNECDAECHKSFKLLFEVRVEIGKHDLEVRGYD